MIAVRFLVAGALLYFWARWRGAPLPALAEARSGAVTGILMLCGGTGGVVVAIRYLDSGLVALLVGMVPLWIAFLMWFWPGGRATSLAAAGGGASDPRRRRRPLVWGLADDEWQRFEPQTVTLTSIFALLYLIVFGSLVAFSAYSWLIRTTEPTLVATYAYVNPVVAIFLGWLIAGEQIGARTLVAAPLIIASVILVTTANGRKARKIARMEAFPSRSPSSDGCEDCEPLEKCA